MLRSRYSSARYSFKKDLKDLKLPSQLIENISNMR